jgi:hypothetical protein
MLFLIVDLMTDTFKGLPIWYWWGGATTFALLYGEHLGRSEMRRANSEPPKDFEWGASLGVSMFWVFIPVFGAGWVAYKLIKLVMK